MAEKIKSAGLILASSSPRRRELLAEGGYEFTVASPTVDEPADLPGDLTPQQHAEALAYFKARSVADSYPEHLVLGADTIVACRGQIMGKPRDADHARAMLFELSRNRHAVITGLALLGPGEQRVITSDTTYVTMRPLSDEQLEQYIAGGEWQGKAGAYGIQGQADAFVEKLEGSFSNVVGLPMELLGKLLDGRLA